MVSQLACERIGVRRMMIYHPKFLQKHRNLFRNGWKHIKEENVNYVTLLTNSRVRDVCVCVCSSSLASSVELERLVQSSARVRAHVFQSISKKFSDIHTAICTLPCTSQPIGMERMETRDMWIVEHIDREKETMFFRASINCQSNRTSVLVNGEARRDALHFTCVYKIIIVGTCEISVLALRKCSRMKIPNANGREIREPRPETKDWHERWEKSHRRDYCRFNVPDYI